jgi:hypothetical protein
MSEDEHNLKNIRALRDGITFPYNESLQSYILIKSMFRTRHHIQKQTNFISKGNTMADLCKLGKKLRDGGNGTVASQNFDTTTYILFCVTLQQQN